MVKKCYMLSCENSVVPGRTFFRFPLDRAKRSEWFDLVKTDLPEDADADSLFNKFICDVHFSPVMYSPYGGRKRLFRHAVPLQAPPRKPKPPPPPPQRPPPVIIPILRIPPPPTKHSVGIQVNCNGKDKEIVMLKRRLTASATRTEKFKSDPPASFIYKHRNKLAKYVTEEAWLLFDCAVQNQQKSFHGYRHTMEVKKLTQQIAQKNRMAFKMLKPIFSLPSLRTLGRMESEPNNTTSNTENTENTVNTVNMSQQEQEDEEEMDNSQRTTSELMSIDNFQMDQTESELENVTDDLHMGNVTFVSVPFPIQSL